MERILSEYGETFVLVGAICTLILVLILVWQFLNRQPRHSLQERLRDRVGGGRRSRAAAEIGHRSLRKDTADSSIAGLDRVIKQLLPRPEKLRARLKRTGTSMTPGVYLMMSLLVALITFYLFAIVAGLAAAASVLAAFATALIVPHMIVGMLIGRRTKKFMVAFPDALDVMIRGLRSGLPLTESMRIVGTEMTGPVGQEFRTMVDAMRIGQEFDQVLWQTAERLDITDFRFFAVTVSIQRETGGNLAETLGNLADVLRKRLQMRLKVKALSSEARASAVIIALLPFIMFGVIFSVNPNYMMPMLTDNRGIVLLVFAGISLLIGVFVMTRMIKLEI